MLIGKMLIQAAFANVLGGSAASPQVKQVQSVQSIGEVGGGVLHCYHPSGKFRTVDVIQSPWARGPQYNAAHALIRIDWNGAFLKTQYVMVVALVERDGKIHAVAQGDNDTVPRNPRCELDQWPPTQELTGDDGRLRCSTRCDPPRDCRSVSRVGGNDLCRSTPYSIKRYLKNVPRGRYRQL